MTRYMLEPYEGSMILSGGVEMMRRPLNQGTVTRGRRQSLSKRGPPPPGGGAWRFHGVNAKTVPQRHLWPPSTVVPYNAPFTLSKLASGFSPSKPPAKLYNTFSVPVVVTLKTVPYPFAPPNLVVP